METFIQVPPDSTGKKVRTLEQTINNEIVHQEVKVISCGTTPENTLRIDEQGQASVRFGEGSPTMDAFGNLRVANAEFIGGYEYTNGDMADLFTDELVGASSAFEYLPLASQTVVRVGSTNNDKAIRTSNRYHYYQPGVGNLIIQTLAHSDTGKAGNVRRWGYFDSDNGIFWELDGSTLSVVIRSNVSGSGAEERISQINWNSDILDGTGVSKMDLDITKANFYFIDFAWLGVGEVRMGVLDESGSRRICHVFKNPNNKIFPYMATGSLPVRYENFNKQATSGTSEFRLICTAVYAESRTDYSFWRFCDISADNKSIGTEFTPVLSMKPKLEVNGKTNRVGIYPCGLSVFVTGGTVQLAIIDDAVLTGSTFDIIGEGTALGDNSATALSAGSKFVSCFHGEGTSNIDLEKVYETNDEGYHVLADASDSYTFTLAARKITGTDVRVYAVLNYRELR